MFAGSPIALDCVVAGVTSTVMVDRALSVDNSRHLTVQGGEDAGDRG